MKKNLLLLILVMPIVCITNAQTIQGHSWTFGAAPPFVSTPAMVGSPTGAHTLTLLGDGASAITVESETVGLGTNCPGLVNVGTYSASPTFSPFGLLFDNDLTFVSNVYTIELTVKFDATGNFHKLIGFTDLSNPVPESPSDYGIYIDPDGLVLFYKGNPTTGEYIGANPIADDTWYQLTFVRDANGVISYYQNGVFQAFFYDSGNELIPQIGNGYDISFFKDNATEEIGGSIAKLNIYNRTLSRSEIANKTFQNVCNTTFLLPTAYAEGYQWTFASTPITSNPAVTGSAGSFDLTTLGTAGLFNVNETAVPTTVGFGTSCTAPFAVGTYLPESGLAFDNEYIDSTYTIELAVNVEAGATRRLIGFTDLATPGFDGSPSDYGIYIDPTGTLLFYSLISEPTGTQVGTNSITPGTWHHLTLVRGANNIITFYQNGVEQGTYDDSAKDFLPQADNAYKISFFKDNTGGADDNAGGQVAKIGIFNTPLALTDVQERFNNICNTALVVLPVSLKSFTAVKADSQVELTWTTSSEQNNLGFEVQRSSDGINFTAIGFVNGNGTTTQENTYHFTDQSPSAGKNYYRLKQIDIDNRATYSSIRSIEMDKDQQRIQLFPNPSRSLITITNIKAGNQMSVFNSQGNLILRKIASSGQESISVEKFAAGVYLLQVTDSDNNKRTIRFSKF